MSLSPSKFDDTRELVEHLQKNGADNITILSPLPLQKSQKGQTCKLNSLHGLLDWSYQQDQTQRKPWPTCKSDDRSQNTSLRQKAKENFGSAIGEIYDINTLMLLAEDNGYQINKVQIPTNSYVNYLKVLLKSNQLPIAYFDTNVDFNFFTLLEHLSNIYISDDNNIGHPVLNDGKTEHSALVVGYYTLNNQDYFVLSQWGKYFFVLGAALAQSANQLMERKPPEIFVMANELIDKPFEKEWAAENSLFCCLIHTFSCGFGPIERQANEIDQREGFRNKVLSIQGRQKTFLPSYSVQKDDNLSEIMSLLEKENKLTDNKTSYQKIKIQYI